VPLGRRQRGRRPGKSLTPFGPGNRIDPDLVKEGEEVQEALQEQQGGTVSRRQLSKHPGFEEVSPEVGMLDEGAFDRALAETPEEALTLLADLTGATDRELARMARRLAGRIVLDLARTGRAQARGVGTLTSSPADRAEGDLDVDASVEALAIARRASLPVALDEVRLRTWRRRSTALCLLIDRSGSMGGNRLTTAAIVAAACAWRAPDDYSVVAFGQEAWVLKAQDNDRRPESVVDDIFTLRGHGVTDVALALRTARRQLERSRGQRRVTVLLSDCRPTTGDEPALAARLLDELAILAPAGDTEDAAALAVASGAAWVPLGDAMGAGQALERVLSM
jgi:Mg-chelatase subunit ChlD